MNHGKIPSPTTQAYSPEPQQDRITDTAGCCAELRKETLAEEAERAARHHHEQAARREATADFYRRNPAFEEFVRLIRNGTLSI